MNDMSNHEVMKTEIDMASAAAPILGIGEFFKSIIHTESRELFASV